MEQLGKNGRRVWAPIQAWEWKQRSLHLTVPLPLAANWEPPAKRAPHPPGPGEDDNLLLMWIAPGAEVCAVHLTVPTLLVTRLGLSMMPQDGISGFAVCFLKAFGPLCVCVRAQP